MNLNNKTKRAICLNCIDFYIENFFEYQDCAQQFFKNSNNNFYDKKFYNLSRYYFKKFYKRDFSSFKDDLVSHFFRYYLKDNYKHLSYDELKNDFKNKFYEFLLENYKIIYESSALKIEQKFNELQSLFDGFFLKHQKYNNLTTKQTSTFKDYINNLISDSSAKTYRFQYQNKDDEKIYNSILTKKTDNFYII